MKSKLLILCICQIWRIEAILKAADLEFDPIDYVSDFRTLTKLPNFVDKTDLLPLLITNATNHTFHIFTAPRKFGKSTIIDMIRRFVEMPVNSSSGEIINKTRTTNYKLFTDTQVGLKISRNAEFVQQHIGEYPTLVVNLTDVRGGSLVEQRPYLRTALQRAAKKYAWLYMKHMEKPFVKTNDSDIVVRNLQFENIGRMITGDDDLSESDMVDGLQDLARAIFDHFGKEPFVLIDSFDRPMQEAIRHNIYEVENVTRFINDVLFMGIRFGPFISHHVVATGTSGSFAKIAASDTIIQTPSFLEKTTFAPYFGLTSSELDQLLGSKNITNEEREKVDLYYNGYYCKGSTSNSSEAPMKIYNMYSIQKYLRDRAKTGKPKFRNYWQRTGSMKNLNFYLAAPDIRGMLYNLILRKSLKFRGTDWFTYRDLEQLKECKNNENPFQADQGTLYFINFIEHGYLTCKDPKNEPDRYHIANLDAEFEFINVLDLFYKSYNVELDPISEIFTKLLEKATCPSDLLDQLKSEVKKAFERLPDANRLSFQTMLFCAARLFYPLTTTRLVDVDEAITQTANVTATNITGTNVTETKVQTVDVVVRNVEQDVLHMYCVKNRQILDVVLKEDKRTSPQDFVAVQGRQNKILGIYLGDHNSIDFEVVESS